MKYLYGNDAKLLRRELRKLPIGRFKARRLYYDYYDSAHAPVETPNAEFRAIDEIFSPDQIKDLFKASGRFSIGIVGEFIYRLDTGYSTYEIKYETNQGE